MGGGGVAKSASDALEGKWGLRAHQTQEMKGKEGSGDVKGQKAKSGLASSGRWLDTSGENGFFADVPTHSVPMLANHRLKDYSYFCPFVLRASTFRLTDTESYWHGNASKPILFISPRGADSNRTHSDSGGHLPSELSALFSLLTFIAIWIFRNLYHSIPLDPQIPT